MPAPAPIQCSVITPEARLLETTASAVVIPAHDGQIGILENRAPLLCELGTGVLRIDTPDQGSMVFYVDGGFAQVLDNEVIILTERAAAAADIVRPEAEKALAAAEQMPLLGEEALQARNRAIARAKAQLRIAPK
jgi:F-type H+-transporting ATPase subunit epsilon